MSKCQRTYIHLVDELEENLREATKVCSIIISFPLQPSHINCKLAFVYEPIPRLPKPSFFVSEVGNVRKPFKRIVSDYPTD